MFKYFWIVSATYLILGVLNIMFAWLGLLCFFAPLLISTFYGSKAYCNTVCGRGQLFQLLGDKFKLSRYRDIPPWMRSSKFRTGFLIFFMAMFINMIVFTVQVAKGVGLREAVPLLWIFKMPWRGVDLPGVSPWVIQFAYGFYGIMLTSTLLGFITMMLYKPRSWCVYCPMGTMTQMICKAKNK